MVRVTCNAGNHISVSALHSPGRTSERGDTTRVGRIAVRQARPLGLGPVVKGPTDGLGIEGGIKYFSLELNESGNYGTEFEYDALYLNGYINF